MENRCTTWIRSIRLRSVIALLAMCVYAFIPTHTAGGIFGKSTSFSGRYIKNVDPPMPLLSRKADLNALTDYGVMRVVVFGDHASEFEMRLLNDFAKQHDLRILQIHESKIEKARAILKKGHADVLIGQDEFDEDDQVSHSLAFNTEEKRGVRWAVRSASPQLQLALNHQINRYLISMGLPDRYKSDLPGLQARKLLRVALQADPHNYYLKNGRPVGFEYDLLSRFAKQHGLWLDVKLAKDEAEMLSLLHRGSVDLISISGTDIEDARVKASLPYNSVSDLLITRTQDMQLHTLSDLNGKLIAVSDARLSDRSLDHFSRQGLRVSVLAPEAGLAFDQFLARVENGQYQVALVSAREFIKQRGTEKGLRILGTTERQSFRSWGFNAQHAKLGYALDAYIGEVYQSRDYNFAYRKYHPEALPGNLVPRTISPYDDLVRKYATDSNFDWRLISAQMYQESQFKPDAVSVSGARGLMQVMPGTAKEVGLKRVHDPEKSIQAGIRYMKKLRDQFGDEIAASERNWFTLAAYNAGYGRIQDARRFAKKLGLDPNRWFSNVEYAMQQLAEKKNRKHTRYGFCRCGQTVVYVRSIKRYYNSYVQLTDPVLVAANDTMETTPQALP